MCIEDYRLGRASAGAVNFVATNGATPVVICPINQRRTRIIVSCDGANRCYIFPSGTGGSAARGIALTATDPRVVIDVEHYGSLLWQEWSATDPAVPSQLCVITVELDKE